jgi:hypothetical protein
MVSIARMTSPGGRQEPGQRPDFEEITLVLCGVLEVGPGQAVMTAPGEWIRYGTPAPEGAEYVAVCIPAFAPATAHRDS